VLIAGLLVFVVFGVVQVAVYFYVRNIVAASAADGARYAANVGVDYGDGARRASSLVQRGLAGGVSRDVPCVGSAGVDGSSGLPTAVVHCSGHLRSVFLPIGALLSIDVTSHALKEGVP
jgi:TadE-like protein